MAEFIDGHVSVKQSRRAVMALMEYAVKQREKREEKELLPGKEESIWLQIAVKEVHAEVRLKPHKIPIKYPLVDPRTSSVCLITKDPQREYKELLEAAGVRFINRIVGIEKLKGKFKSFEARRALLRENALFLADERIFFSAKKQPIPVCLKRKNLKDELERAISSTYMHQNRGTCTYPAQILANLETALPAIIAAVRGGWGNVQSLSIKSTKSTSLPIWSCQLGTGEGGRWHGLALEAQESEGDDEIMMAETSISNKNKNQSQTTSAAGKEVAAS
ncbi:ribosomal protein L1p/L10e family-domain-containing protein [Russula earlei]|uniref:Ribosomal protein L1p/L10e family-domain-containing protein n=1 Tax=Russula earlei TaxID=71964 RepID=A0ACC0U8F8_9AGAM|nr:ribosomal protein L1p/L10e family-domain-containing protein [Russula earlei]